MTVAAGKFKIDYEKRRNGKKSRERRRGWLQLTPTFAQEGYKS